jgi:DNA-binding Lrp family transcriptional regulator
MRFLQIVYIFLLLQIIPCIIAKLEMIANGRVGYAHFFIIFTGYSHQHSTPALLCRNLFILTEGARVSGHMIIAYVLIATTMGEEKSVAEKLAKMKEVEVADILYGEWDIILRVKVENLAELDSFLTRTVRKMKNIKLTSTLIAS